MTRRLNLGYVFLVFSLLLWSGNTIVGRWAADVDIPPIGLNFWRWVVALCIFLPFTWRKVLRSRAVILRRWRYLAGFGLVSIACFNTFYYFGLQYTTAVQGSLIQSILPVLVLLLGAVLLREGISARQIGGVILSIGGAATIVLRGDFSVLQTLRLNIGDLWCLLAVSVWAIQTFILRWRPAELDITTFMTVVIAIGVTITAPFAAWEWASGRPMPVTQTSVVLILYVAVFASVIASSMYNEGAYRIGGATAGYFGNLFPVFSAVLAVVILGESLALFHFAGGAMVLGGIYLATMTGRRAPAAARTG